MVASLYFNRCRGYSIIGGSNQLPKRTELDDTSSIGSGSEGEENLLYAGDRPEGYGASSPWQKNRYSKTRDCCGITVRTPNSSRFASHIHSRVLQRFPFLVEMFYWVLNYLFYACTKSISQSLSPPDKSVVQVSQAHGISVLNLEHQAPVIKWLYPVDELDFQLFFLDRFPGLMTFFNRIYSVVHIPGTVAFLSWYYLVAPNHRSFATVRRTMTLGNLVAFITFCFWPCMPPRLLPKPPYRFHDTVRQEHAESVWAGGKSVNQLAAMPSLHFTYALSVGCTLIWHSGILQRMFRRDGWVTSRHRTNNRISWWSSILLVTLALAYLGLVLTVVVATANHYWMDATAAVFTTAFSFLCNRVLNALLPVEDWLLWALRVEKPIATTGNWARRNRFGDSQFDIEATYD